MYDHTTLGQNRTPAPSRLNSDVVSHVGKLTDVLLGPLADLAIQNLRVRPRQARSLKSVGRILSVATEMVFRQGEMRTISIESISVEAGVTPQAAYRYFKDVENLIKMGLRCLVVREYEQIVERASSGMFVDERDVAKNIVQTVIDTCEMFLKLSIYLREQILGEYRQFGYDASHRIAELIVSNFSRVDIIHDLSIVKVSAGLTAIVAVATSFVLKGFFSLRDRRFESMLIDLFVSVVRSGEEPSIAVREMEGEIDALWLTGAS